jgi:flagellar assembly protein FliH
MSAAKKFLFEYSFDPVVAPEPDEQEASAEPPAPPEPTFSEAELEAARASAYAEGHGQGVAEGRASEQQTTERLASLALNQIAGELGRLADAIEGGRAERVTTAAEIGLALARRFLPEYARRHGSDEILSMIRACVAELQDEPRITVRVAAEVAEELAAPLEQLAQTRGLTSGFRILPDPSLGPSDARLEWSDGSAERDATRFWSDVDAAAERTLGHPGRLAAE